MARYGRELGLIKAAHVLFLLVELGLVAGFSYSYFIDDHLAREYVGHNYPHYFVGSLLLLVVHFYSLLGARDALEKDS